MHAPLPATPHAGSHAGLKALYAANVIVAASAWAADMNRTHMFNPAWPPHAKFHDGITISLASLTGAAGLYFLARQPFEARVNTALGALMPALFFGAQASAFLYPGARGIEAENPRLAPRVAGVRMNELPFSLAGLALAGIGYLLATKARR